MSYPYDPYNWTSAQQAIVDRIMSGQQDYTFGPGSPNPTTEDFGTYVGGPYSPAGGFAVHGGVALAPKEYNLFSPEQRRYLGIMDVAPADQAGKIERYYSSSGSPSRGAFMAPSPATGGAYAMGTAGAQGSNAGAMGMYDPSVNYGGAPSQTSQGIAAGLGALSSILSNMGKSSSKGVGDPMAMMGQQRPLSWYSPAQFPQVPYT